MQTRARSALHDDRVAALLTAIASAPEKLELPEPREPDIDWTSFYGAESHGAGGASGLSSFLGPIAARQLPGRGIGLVTTRNVRAGELLLLEAAWTTSSTKGAASSVAIAELTDACLRKLARAEEDERALFWCLHGAQQSGGDGWQSPNLRLAVFEQYLQRLNRSAKGSGPLSSPLPAWPSQNLQSAVSSRVASNSRRSETWNSLTLLLDETQALGGLWFGASLFNHSCCANVTLSYGFSKEPF